MWLPSGHTKMAKRVELLASCLLPCKSKLTTREMNSCDMAWQRKFQGFEIAKLNFFRSKITYKFLVRSLDTTGLTLHKLFRVKQPSKCPNVVSEGRQVDRWRWGVDRRQGLPSRRPSTTTGSGTGPCSWKKRLPRWLKDSPEVETEGRHGRRAPLRGRALPGMRPAKSHL
jgi:hypothetical protein